MNFPKWPFLYDAHENGHFQLERLGFRFQRIISETRTQIDSLKVLNRFDSNNKILAPSVICITYLHAFERVHGTP